jgi:hypothetical protein
MTPEPFEYEPLENVFRAIEAESDETELKRCLQERGLNPDKTTEAVSAKVGEFLKRHRLSWQDVAKQKQAKLEAAAARVVSWATRKKEEIEEAFSGVQSGTFGPAAQMKLQVAFRNLSNVPLQDKASFLDEIETLRQLKESKEPPEQPS